MNRFAEYCGPIGLGTVTAGVLIRLFAPHRDRFWSAFLIIGLVLTVSYVATHWRKMMDLAGRREARHGTNLAILVVLVAVILVVVNRLGFLHNKRWDLTASKQYSLSAQSVKILGNLDRDLEIIIFDNILFRQKIEIIIKAILFKIWRSNKIILPPDWKVWMSILRKNFYQIYDWQIKLLQIC